MEASGANHHSPWNTPTPQNVRQPVRTRDGKEFTGQGINSHQALHINHDYQNGLSTNELFAEKIKLNKTEKQKQP